ncbi:hypothetical protein [Ideonella sp. YS5]|uniref:hypothetical protein n=1 Tax=Ideonella sp. YS5 TaxID=3453714 RepID=UPI003EEB87EC
MPIPAAPPWPTSPDLLQGLGMVVCAAVLLLGVSALAAICARCHDVSRRFALAAGVLALMIALPAWTMHIASRP